VSKTSIALKRLIVGRPKSSGELEHTLLPKFIALPVFSSDPLSSNAYATQETLLVLGLAGSAALSLVIPISIAVAALLAIVVTSYRQTVRAYPTGGGAYRVSRENLGLYPGLIAASALLVDYVLTVAVSMVAGVDAITSAMQSLTPYKIQLAVAFIVLLTLANLRGAKESGILFAMPTYGFVLSIYILLGTGFIKCLGGCPTAESAGHHIETQSALTAFLILKAFSAGTTALTGVEAIADGVPAFRYPQSRNAATTLGAMGALSISMFLGISWLANHTHVVFSHDSERTVVAQIAAAIFDNGPMFFVVQAMSAAILILAANTAYQDFPRLSSILADDRVMPRQFMNRGDRLVFSNGILVLALAAILLIYAFDANLNSLIQLYLVGVFISFTFSQAGMVIRSRKLRPPGWRKTILISGFGALVTGTVLCVVVATKFLGGAWIVLTAIPILVFGMRSILVHYKHLAQQLAMPHRKPVDRRPGNQHIVILVSRIDVATARAVGYARSLRTADIHAVSFDKACGGAWKRLAKEIPFTLLSPDDGRLGALRSYLRRRRAELSPDDFLTLVIPEVLKRKGLLEIIRRPRLHRLKAALLSERGVQVIDIPIVGSEIDPHEDQAHEASRHHAVVLVSGVHNATLQAIEYAETLQPTSLRAVLFGLDPASVQKVGNEWLAAGIPHPLEIEASPFRDMGTSITHYVRRFRPDGVNRVVTVVIPEFIVSKKRHQLLHGQTALLVKRHLLFETGVVVASVPYHVEEDARPSSRDDPESPVRGRR
jgi:amino acid transporter